MCPLVLNAGVETFGDFNDTQMRVIQYAEEIFHSHEIGRLHLVHGPPGPIHILVACLLEKLQVLYPFRNW